MSYADGVASRNWRYIGCFLLGMVLSLVTLAVAALWYLSFWDSSTGTYRAVVIADFLIVPGTVIGSGLVLWLYFQKFMRDRT
ncbi:hypothetical protein [Sphingomonas sp.]|uniref:hypothetical protein n=1 Tax=Sphingomonas sp. TaxID=28214 RepID=UPI002ED9C7E1